MKNYSSNEFWEEINLDIVNIENLTESLENFRSSPVNYKLSIFNPEKNGVRYLKTLLYNLTMSLTKEEFIKITNIKNRNFGNPFYILYENEKIDLDYLQAIYEISFLENNISLKDLDILEIGAGYGRTAHAILSNYDIKSYTIIDLEKTLQISRKYLQIVLPENLFQKIVFLSVENLVNYKFNFFDLVINIDSFAEMSEEVVFQYFDLINTHSKYFYTKNPVGKYLDKTLDNHSQGESVVNQALKNGILKEILDIDSNQDIKQHSYKFLDGYKPNKKWNILQNSWAPPFSYYWQVIYVKGDTNE